MIKWENLPERIKNEKTYPYYELLQQKKIQILWKRVLDFFCAVVLTVLLSPVMLLIAAAIKLDTKRTDLLQADTCHQIWDDLSNF